MNMDGVHQDVIGYLRATNMVILLWDIWPIEFPLDAHISRALTARQADFRAILWKVAEFCDMTSELPFNELLSAIDDIESEQASYYDRLTIDAYLSLYASSATLINFTYDDRSTFFEETSPVFALLLCRLTSSMYWVRAQVYQGYPDLALPHPKESLLEIYSTVLEYVPTETDLPGARQMLSRCTSQWLGSDDVKRSLLLTQRRTTGFTRLIEELQGF